MSIQLSFCVVTETGFPHGLSCQDCNRGIDIGQPYKERLSGMTSNSLVISELFCVYC